MALHIAPTTLREANAFVAMHHRHHRPTTGHKFSIGLRDENENLVGVCICGRPVSRNLDNGRTLEVNRLCTDGSRNACSMLYGAAARAAKAMGYDKIITYILATEPGTSLKAAGYHCEDKAAGGGEWHGVRKPKDPNQYPVMPKQRWVRFLHNLTEAREARG